MDEPDIRYARNGDVSLAYQVTGDGPLDLVFVSGFVSHQEVMWEHPRPAHFAKRLESFSRLLRYDKRGQGLSDRPGRPPTLEESMDDLRAVMDAAGCERAALFGISEGGPMCQLFAATYPDRVPARWPSTAPTRGSSEAPGLRDRDSAGGCSTPSRETVREDWGGPDGARAVRAEPWPRIPRSATGGRACSGPGTSPQGAVALLAALPRDRHASGAARHQRADAGDAPHGRSCSSPSPRRPTWPSTSRGRATSCSTATDHLMIAGDQDAILDEVEEFLTGAQARAGARPHPRHRDVHRHRVVHRARRASSATAAGASCSRATTRSCGGSSTATAAGR